MKSLVNVLLRFVGRRRSNVYRIVSLMFGFIFFLGKLPAGFICVGLLLKEYIPINLSRNIETVIASVGTITGLYFLLWATLSQWRIGKGTPAPNAPTQSLVIIGPYRYCRNPIELGAINYYLGIGIFLGGIIVGVTAFLLGFIVGSIYHKFIEEKELEIRFGEEYKRYRQTTPFLFPRITFGKKDIV